MADQLISPVRRIGFYLGPLAFVFILIINHQWIDNHSNLSSEAYKVLAVTAWMVIWWVTESVNIPVTALLPLILYPFLGIMKLDEAAAPYANPIIFLFMGGFMLALALEKHKLHERIALNLIKLTGTSGNGIFLGFMFATSFISMWISNTATAMMMLPIATSVINLLKKDKQHLHELPKAEKNFALGLMLMLGYAATLGGLATIIGTPPNMVFAGLYNEFYHEKLHFGKWMLVGVPLMVALLFSTYFIITRILFPNRLQEVEGSRDLIQKRLQELGPIRSEEKRVLFIFMLTSLLWIFQQYINYQIGRELFNDTNIAMIGGFLMFITPGGNKQRQFLLEWTDTQRMAWGILILFGGGLCLAKALEKAKIIQLVGSSIASLEMGTLGLILALIAATVILSEFMSNVALVQIFVPVVFGIATVLQINPILLGLPVTFAASIGFMFPVATPPNAIVFSSGHIRIKDMMRAGIVLDVISIAIILLASLTVVKWVYG